MDSIQHDRPSLLEQTQAMIRRAIAVGFKWVRPDGTLNTQEAAKKVREELGELEDAIAQKDPAHIKEEAGDLMRAAITMAEYAGVDAEEALQQNNKKFTDRFYRTEKNLKAQGLEMETAPFKKIIDAWIGAKTEQANAR